MIKEMSVSDYCKKYKINRHSVHRRIQKHESSKVRVNNIIGVKRIGPKIIILEVDTIFKFAKKKNVKA